MYYRYFIFSLFLGSISCCIMTPDSDTVLMKKQIDALDTDQKREDFLQHILDEDQNDRIVDNPDMMDNDLYRLSQVGYYLERYGYPSKNFGRANTAPYLVIHHSPINKARFKYFKYLYKAYLAGDLDSGTLAFFLGRFQQTTNGHWIDFDRPFTEQEEIDTLIAALKLKEEVKRIQDSYNKSTHESDSK